MESLELMPARIKITSILKKALMSGEYKSGDELSLTAVAQKLGVSRTPVREAFQTLAAEGLIELRMNKGAVVKPIDEKFVRDHFEMRALLESEAAARAAANGMEVSTLLARLYHLSDNLEKVGVSTYTDLNYAIHTSVWKAADNQKLTNFLESLWNGPSTGRGIPELEHFRLSTEEHIRLLLAIKGQDAEAARTIMRSHIERSAENILKTMPSNT